jgi:hypothetical protein
MMKRSVDQKEHRQNLARTAGDTSTCPLTMLEASTRQGQDGRILFHLQEAVAATSSQVRDGARKFLH